MTAFLLAAMNFGRTAMGALLQFVSRPPGSYIAAAVLAALAIWGSGELGWRRGENYGQTTCEAVHAAASATTTSAIDAPPMPPVPPTPPVPPVPP